MYVRSAVAFALAVVTIGVPFGIASAYDLIRDADQVKGDYQIAPVDSGISQRLARITLGGNNFKIDGRCRYFAVVETPRGPGLLQVIVLSDGTLAMPIYRPKDYQVVFDDRLSNPWVAIRFKWARTEATLHLSHAQYDGCPCLKDEGIK